MTPFEVAVRAGPWLPPVLFGASMLVPFAIALFADRNAARRLLLGVEALRVSVPQRATPTEPSADTVFEGKLEHDEGAEVESFEDGQPCAITSASARVGLGGGLAHRAARGLRIVLDDGGILPLVGESELVWGESERVQPPRLSATARARIEGALGPNAPPFETMRISLRRLRRGDRARVRGRVRALEDGASYRALSRFAIEPSAGERAISVAPRIHAPRPNWLPMLALTTLVSLVALLAVTRAASAVLPRDEWVRYDESDRAAYRPGIVDALALGSFQRPAVLADARSRVDQSILDAELLRTGMLLADQRSCAEGVWFASTHGLDDEVIAREPRCAFRGSARLHLAALRHLGRIDDAVAFVRAHPGGVPWLEAARALVEAGDLEGARVLMQGGMQLCLGAALRGMPLSDPECGVLGAEAPLDAAMDHADMRELARDMHGLADVLLGHPPACDALCRVALASEGPSPVEAAPSDAPFSHAPHAVLAALRIRELVILGDADAARAMAAREPVLGTEGRLAIDAFVGDPTNLASAIEGAHLDRRTTARLAGIAIARLDGRLQPLADALHDYPPTGVRFCGFDPDPYGLGRAALAPDDSRGSVLDLGGDRSGRELAHAMGTDGATTALWLAAQHVERSPGELAHHLAYYAQDLPFDESIARMLARAILLRTIARTLGDQAFARSLDARIDAWDALLDRGELARPLRAIDDALRRGPPPPEG